MNHMIGRYPKAKAKSKEIRALRNHLRIGPILAIAHWTLPTSNDSMGPYALTYQLLAWRHHTQQQAYRDDKRGKDKAGSSHE